MHSIRHLAASSALLLLASFPAFGDPESPFKLISLGMNSTSDHIDDRFLIVSYRSHRRDLFWAYPDEKPQAWDWGTSLEFHQGDNSAEVYRGLKYQLEGARKFSEKLLVDADAGFHRLQNISTDDYHTAFAGQIKADYTPIDATTLELGFSNDYIYPDLIQPGAVSEAIQARSIFLNGTERAAERIRLASQFQYQFFNDDNQRRHVDLSALYGLSTGVPWIWIGLGSEFLSYTTAHSDYWSPQRFFAIGPRFEADVPLSGKWSASGGFNLSEFQEEEYDWGLGYYVSGKIRYGTRETCYIDLGALQIRSTQNGNLWSAYGFTLDIGAAL